MPSCGILIVKYVHLRSFQLYYAYRYESNSVSLFESIILVSHTKKRLPAERFIYV